MCVHLVSANYKGILFTNASGFKVPTNSPHKSHTHLHTHTHTHAYIHACAPGSAVAAAAVPLLRLWLAAAEHVRHAVHPLTSAGQVS
jgi:hypothetical protein